MSVLDRSELEASPLADLHAIANQLGLDGFRRLRKAELIGAILGEPSTEGAGSADGQDSGDGSDERGSSEPRASGSAAGGARKRRTPRLRRGAKDEAKDSSADERESSSSESSSGESSSSSSSSTSRSSSSSDSSRRGRGTGERDGRGARAAAPSNGRSGAPSAKQDTDESGAGSRKATGVVELLGNGSAFLRVDPPEPSDDDVYISAAQVRRCELVSGDRVSGPVRLPRRSERYPSMIRVDRINGTSADAVSEGPRYEDLPVAYASERLALDAGDPTLDAIEWLTPLGRGSRAVIVGPARAGKTEILRRLLKAVTDKAPAGDGPGALEVTVVLTGARPEEIAEWQEGTPAPAAALSFAASPDAQGQAAERALDAAKRTAVRGGDALVLIDGLDGMHPHAARKALAAARNLRDGGSVTVIATAARPFGGETTVIALDAGVTDGDLPNLDLAASGTLKPELLVGEDGAKAIAKARAEARDS
jgi:transcription termination factor Rho